MKNDFLKHIAAWLGVMMEILPTHQSLLLTASTVAG